MSKQELFFAEMDEIADSYDLNDIENCLEKIKKIEENIDSLDSTLKCGLYRRKAEYLYVKSNYVTDRKKRFAMLEQAYNLALQGHSFDENDFNCCKVLCSTSGRLAEESGMKQKLQYGFLFKTYLDKAISINDEDFEAVHMRGRFCFTVADLSIVEKIAAKVIGQIPNVSYQDAIRDLLKAESICPGVAENQLFLGKSYLAIGDYENAKKWLEITSKNKSEVAVEQEYIQEAAQMLKDKKLK